jgi:hypothetical protein
MNRIAMAAARRRRPIVLAVAMLAAGLLIGCGGDSDTTGTAAAESSGDFEALSELAALRDQVDAAISELESAAGADDVARASKDLEATVRRSRALARDSQGGAGAAPAIRRSSARLAAAAVALDEVAADMRDLYEQTDLEREPSTESQDRVVELSQQLAKLRQRLEGPTESLRAAAAAAQRALASLQDELASDQVSEVARMKVAFARASRKDALAGVDEALARKASELTDRVDALEPPDVVDDCTSQYYPNVTDLSVRNMDCAEADALTTQAIQALAPSFSIPGWSCSILGDYGPPEGPILGATDIRCESGEQAFRFSFGD